MKHGSEGDQATTTITCTGDIRPAFPEYCTDYIRVFEICLLYFRQVGLETISREFEKSQRISPKSLSSTSV